MKQFTCAAILLTPLLMPLGAQMARETAIARAEAILENLQNGNTSAIVKELDERMARDLPESKLKPAWQGVVAQFGAFKNIVERREGMTQGRQAVELILAFEKQTIVHRIVFDASGKVAGLVFRPLDASVLPPNR